jgi:hypothetical protein
MSRKGDGRDGAPTESFFSTLERDLIHDTVGLTRTAALQEVFEYIEVL